ncbi:hypothetical protein B484DRAFT_425710, partial [Ochromonadaceae sp. CCMP2298]
MEQVQMEQVQMEEVKELEQQLQRQKEVVRHEAEDMVEHTEGLNSLKVRAEQLQRDVQLLERDNQQLRESKRALAKQVWERGAGLKQMKMQAMR